MRSGVFAKLRSLGTKKPAPRAFSIQEALVMSELSSRKTTSDLRVHICKFSPAIQQLREKIKLSTPTAECKSEAEKRAAHVDTPSRAKISQKPAGVELEREREPAAACCAETPEAQTETSEEALSKMPESNENENEAFIGE
jgi:hypothetical protein